MAAPARSGTRLAPPARGWLEQRPSSFAGEVGASGWRPSAAEWGRAPPPSSKALPEMGLLEGKRAAVFGVANDHSIAWAIARGFHAEGAELALTYPNEAIEKRVRPLAESLGVKTVLECDVTRDEQIDATFSALRDRWGTLDALVHAVAYAGRDELKGRFLDTTRAGFNLALEVSAYSLVALARGAAPLFPPSGGSILTLTYLGSQYVVPNY